MDAQWGGGGDLVGWALGCCCLLKLMDTRMAMSAEMCEHRDGGWQWDGGDTGTVVGTGMGWQQNDGGHWDVWLLGWLWAPGRVCFRTPSLSGMSGRWDYGGRWDKPTSEQRWPWALGWPRAMGQHRTSGWPQ